MGLLASLPHSLLPKKEPLPKSKTTYQAAGKQQRGTDYQLLVKNQKTYNGKPVELIKDGNASFSLKFTTNDNRTLETKDLFFSPTLSGNTLSMKLHVSDNQYLEYVYTLRPDEYMVDFSIRSVGLSQVFNTGVTPELLWKLKARRMEKSVTYEDRYVQAVVQYEDNRDE